MPDREKVANGLRHCLPDECTRECPYINDSDCTRSLMQDTLALLKEREAVVPKKVKGYNPPMYTIYGYKCEECKSPMMSKQPFCMGCGRPVKWE